MIPNTHLILTPSFTLLAWISACGAGSLIVIYYLSMDLWLKMILVVSILSYTLYLYLHKGYRLLPYSYLEIQQLTGIEWLLTSRDGRCHAVTLRADTFISSWLIILRFQRTKSAPYFFRTISIPLFANEIHPKIWRILNIYLRWQAQQDLRQE